MAQPKEDLADFVRRVREKAGLSTRDVAKRSGGLISHGYVSQIENRAVLGKGVSPGRLLGLARGLGISDDEVFAVARGSQLTQPEAKAAQAMLFFSSLSEEKQNEALDFLQMFSKRYGSKPTKS